MLRPPFGGMREYRLGAESVAIADFTGDGRADVASATRGGVTTLTVALLVQRPEGDLAPPQRFEAHTGDGIAVAVTAGDVDGDGDADLLVGSSNGIDVFEQHAGTLRPPRHIPGLQVYGIDAADINGDGRLDLVVDTVMTSGLRTMLGLGGGEFAPPAVVSTGDSPYGDLEVGDVTGDGVLDLVGHHITTVHVRAGRGDGTFAAPVEWPIPFPSGQSYGLALGDFNGDGRSDVAVGNKSNSPASRVHVLYQSAAGDLSQSLTLPSLDLASPLEAADMNLDGRTDLVVGHAGWSYVGIYLQLPDGTLAPEQREYVGHVELHWFGGLAVGDVDSDGVPDIVASDPGTVTVLRAGSRARTWGFGGFGQLGPGGTGDALIPGPPLALPPIAAVAGGGYHNVAVAFDGTAWTWGLNNAGQLGDGTTVMRASPLQVPGLTGVTAVAAGTVNSAAVRRDGTVWTWGWNDFGQLGTGDTSPYRAAPARVPSLAGVTAVAMGVGHSLAVTADGSVWAWGLGHVGQLGTGTVEDSAVPVKVNGLTNVVAVAAGNFHSLALTRDGDVWSWGLNDKGQLGIGSSALYKTSPMLTSVSHGSEIAAGAYHSVALAAGQVWAWGLNTEGELGDGTGVNRNVPVSPGCCAERIVAGWYHTVAVSQAGQTIAWGWNHFGQLGDGTTANALRPVEIPTLNTAAVGAGIAHTVAVATRGG